MELKVNDKLFIINIDPGETFIIEFCPDEPLPGSRARGRRISFTISAMTMPNNTMALNLKFPDRRLYRVPNGPFVLCDIAGFSGMTIEDGEGKVTELEKAT